MIRRIYILTPVEYRADALACKKRGADDRRIGSIIPVGRQKTTHENDEVTNDTPASMTSIVTFGSSESREATTQPA